MNINLEKCKTQTSIKNKVREAVFEKLIELLTVEFGEENVSIVGNSEVSTAVTLVKCSDGSEGEVCFNIKPVIKDYEQRTTTTKTFSAYERLLEADAYEAEKSEKEKQAEEKAKKKAKKIEKDKIKKEEEKNKS